MLSLYGMLKCELFVNAVEHGTYGVALYAEGCGVNISECLVGMCS